MRFDVAAQPLHMLTEFEIPVLLLDLGNDAPFLAEGAVLAALFVREELLLTL